MKETSSADQVEKVFLWLNENKSPATLAALERYAIPTTNAIGVPRESLKRLAKALGRNQALAESLWETGVYEARTLVSLIGDPKSLTSELMDHWCNGIDSWAICDAMCFNFFDRSPLAWDKVEIWSDWPGEFQKRTSFALLWSLASHEKQEFHGEFIRGLRLIERDAL